MMQYEVYAVLSEYCTEYMLYSVYAVLGLCWTPCLLYSVYAGLCVCCTWCLLLIIAWRDREGILNFVFLGDGTIEDKKERDETVWGKPSSGTGT